MYQVYPFITRKHRKWDYRLNPTNPRMCEGIIALHANRGGGARSGD